MKNKNDIVLVFNKDQSIDYFECGSWDFAHNSRMLMLNSIKETPEAKRPRMGIDMNNVLYFHDITDDPEELKYMKNYLEKDKPKQII